jgi:hypothetical protein
LCLRLAAAAGTDHELGGQYFDCRCERRIFDPGEQAMGGTAAEVAERLADRRQPRIDEPAGVHVVEPGHRHIGRDPDACPLEFAQHSDGHLVVGAHHGLRQRLAGEQRPGGRDAAVLREVTLDDRRDAAARAGRDGLLECQPPFRRVRRVVRAGHEAESLVLVLLGQMPGHGRHPADVVAEENVHRGLLAAAGDDDDGYLLGQSTQFALFHDFLGDEQAVGLPGQRTHPLAEQLAGTAEGQQQRVLGPAEDVLGRVHDVVDEQQAGALDVDFVGAAVQADQPDDVLPPPGKAAGRRVGDEAERLDHGQHALAGIGMHQVGPAQHPGHGGGRHRRHPGDIVDRRHADPFDMSGACLAMSPLTWPRTWGR